MDRRVVRTRRALGEALMRLLLERDLESITVQDVLDAAGVGRSTFYGHFRGKRDLLLSHFESVMGWMGARLRLDPPGSLRVAPVEELCSHLADARRTIDAIAASGQLDSIWDLGRSHLSVMIAGRIARVAPELESSRPRLSMVGRFYGGALVEQLKWWLWRADRPTPSEMDVVFHRMVWSGLPGVGGVDPRTTDAVISGGRDDG